MRKYITEILYASEGVIIGYVGHRMLDDVIIPLAVSAGCAIVTLLIQFFGRRFLNSIYSKENKEGEMTLNNAILESISKLNEHKGKGYFWDSSGKTGGTIGDILWENKLILKGAEDETSYCCGITLQAYLMACEKIGKHLGTPSDVAAIKREWFIQNHDKLKGPVDALVPKGHGIEITDINEALPGDLVQLWRKSGSGHSVIFISSFTENGIRAVKYWSSQTATNGVGYRTEYFEGVKNPIVKIHICRPI